MDEKQFQKNLGRLIAPLRSRVMMTVARGVLSLLDDSKTLQIVQARFQSSEVREDLERVQNYGFTSNPLPNAEVAAVFIGGNRDHGLVLAIDDRRYRLKNLEEGEVAIYTDEGDNIILKRNNTIELSTQNLIVNTTDAEVNSTNAVVNSDQITTNGENLTVNASAGVVFNTPSLQCTGEITDNASGSGLSMSTMRSIYNSHTHQENNTSGPTDEPNQLME